MNNSFLNVNGGGGGGGAKLSKLRDVINVRPLGSKTVGRVSVGAPADRIVHYGGVTLLIWRGLS